MTEECEIAMSQGDTFPSHWSCGENVVWQLSYQSKGSPSIPPSLLQML
jgi:hypothetical protein